MPTKSVQRKGPVRAEDASPGRTKVEQMQDRHSTAPYAAQSRDLTARLVTVADLNELDQIGCTLAEIPPGYVHAIVSGEDVCGRREGPVAVPAADAVQLDAMSDGEILAHLGSAARHFFRFVRDDRVVYEAADSRRRRRRADWPETLKNAPRNRAERIAKLDILRRRCSTGGGHAG